MAETLQEFAISQYRHANVAACCLRLQDMAGADVNMLLTAAWLAARGRCWQREQVCALIAQCREWRQHCLLPLRGVRRYLRGHALYERVKSLEIDAEVHQLRLLDEALQAMTLSATPEHSDAFIANLRIYIDCINTIDCINMIDRMNTSDCINAPLSIDIENELSLLASALS